MVRITRSNELLKGIEGLHYLHQDVIDLSALFFNELRSIRATFGENAIDNLIPHVSSLLSKLNDTTKSNEDLKRDIEDVRLDLVAAENRCTDLNKSFKGISLECCELESKQEDEVRQLNLQIAQCKKENEQLKEQIDRHGTVNTANIIAEHQQRIDLLSGERKCLLTTIEVLEAEIESMRLELKRLEIQVSEQPIVEDDENVVLAELPTSAATEATLILPSVTAPPTPAINPTPQATPPPTSSDTSDPPCVSHHTKDFKKVLLIGDSHLRHSSFEAVVRGAHLECCPGANNLRRGYRGRPGYNGGHGKREALHSIADLLFTAKTRFQNTKIFFNSVLTRRDITYKALFDFNSQVELMCNNFDVTFVEANCHVSKRDLSRDGVHFNRRAVARLGSLFVDVMAAALYSPPPCSEPASNKQLESSPEQGN
ncbi:hypothetical protein J6590_031045 [Homalodisca vitripennis]|nr:hypothetical protein J6590_031045 [Homalodisca vitripennis]